MAKVNTFVRMALVAGMAGAVQAASAQASFSLVAGYYTLDSSGPFNFNFIPDNANMVVDFIPVAPSFKVGDSTTFGSGVGTIIYNVTTSVPIIGIDLTFQGTVNQWGEVNYTETAEQGTHNLGSINGFVHGSSYTGGIDGAYTHLDHLTFNQAVTSFTVKKTFDIDIAANRPPSASTASVSLIEQNLDPVPEPGSIIGLAIGASALVARRRRK